MLINQGLNDRAINTAAQAAGPVSDDILESAQSFAEPVVLSRQVATDKIDEATATAEPVALIKQATQDVESLAESAALALTQVQGAVADLLADANADSQPLTLVTLAAVDLMETAGSDDSVLQDIQTGPTGEEQTEEIDREDTILQQIATFRQDVEEVAAYEDELVSQRQDFTQDVLELTPAWAEVFLDTPFYRQALEELATLEAAVVATQVDGSTDLASDATADGDPLTLVTAASVDVDEEVLAEGYAAEVQADDIMETARASGEVPGDPIREDIYEWIWPRDRIANTYTDDLEEVRAVADSLEGKLRMDIAVDVNALVELVSESRANKASITEAATADALFESTIQALASLEEETYIGAAVTKGTGSFYNTLVEDANGSDALTQKLVTSDDLAVDANGRDDVAGTAWFKAHSFIEEATASEELLTEIIRRPTKDDVLEAATANVDLLTARLDAWASWSEDALAEEELLGNESGEAWVFNTRTLAFSRYVDFDASQVTTVDDKPLAAGTRGVMGYSATRAEGYVKTGLSDYGVPQLKRVRHAYVTAASRQPLALSTLHGIGDVLQRTTYQIATLDSTVPYTHRLNLARGDQGQFWAFELRAPGGTPTTLLNLRVIPLVTSRRI